MERLANGMLAMKKQKRGKGDFRLFKLPTIHH